MIFEIFIQTHACPSGCGARFLQCGPRMNITTQRAFWILDYYRSHQTVLVFGGRVLGEDAVCEALIYYVWPETQAIGIELLSGDGGQSWDRIVSFRSAIFYLVQMSDSEFEQFANPHLHSILIAAFQMGRRCSWRSKCRRRAFQKFLALIPFSPALNACEFLPKRDGRFGHVSAFSQRAARRPKRN